MTEILEMQVIHDEAPLEMEIDFAGEYVSGATNEEYEKGKRAAQVEWWETYLSTRDGRTHLNSGSYVFGFWNSDSFYPTQDISLRGADRAFYNFGYNAPALDLTARLEECGVKLDVSKMSAFDYIFANARITRIPELYFPNKVAFIASFNNSTLLKVIDKIILNEAGTSTFNSSTFNCKNLEEIRFEGAIGTSITFQYCPLLSVESMKSIILHLVNYTGTDKELTHTVTFVEDCWTRLEESGPAPTGTTWKEYIDSLGWLW